MMRRAAAGHMAAVLMGLLGLQGLAWSQDTVTDGPGRGAVRWVAPAQGNGPAHRLTALPALGPVDVVLGRPTAHSVVLSALRHDHAADAQLAWRRDNTEAAWVLHPERVSQAPGHAHEWLLEGLQADTAYRYELRDASTGAVWVEGRFHTQRAAGRRFVFTVTADSHLDQNTDSQLFLRTLDAARGDRPDFHIDLGDTFMVDKHASAEAAAEQYRAQRRLLGSLAREVPLFLVLGNHDGEDAKLRRSGADSPAVWANQQRKRLFPNPMPDGFYTGNSQPDPLAGPLQDYYAWHWGDALFVVLNPYWHAPSRRGEERWALSLGDAQYRWLRHTLQSSRARHKFVFVHQLVGGLDRQGRGGVEGVPFGEWGGLNADGSAGLQTHRPGWEEPIHALLRRTGVTMVLHGHDHLFAQQTLDGITYQEVPQPGHPGVGLPRSAEAYGYRQGVVLGGSGYMRFEVADDGVTAEFVAGATGRVLHRYQLSAKRAGTQP